MEIPPSHGVIMEIMEANYVRPRSNKRAADPPMEAIVPAPGKVSCGIKKEARMRLR